MCFSGFKVVDGGIWPTCSCGQGAAKAPKSTRGATCRGNKKTWFSRLFLDGQGQRITMRFHVSARATANNIGESDMLPLSCFASVERETGFEPATSTLARLHSTTELLPRGLQTAKCKKTFWRRHPDLNWRWRFCRPLPYHLAMPPEKNLERETGFEPATSTLARLHSTTELLPLSEVCFYVD